MVVAVAHSRCAGLMPWTIQTVTTPTAPIRATACAIAGVMACAMVVCLGAPAAAGDGSWVWPVDGSGIGARFDPPETPYGPGHRGIDLPALVGAPVRAVAAGVVVFAGRIAGVGVVSVDHGGERSTYQPVTPTVRVGDHLAAGETIGTVSAGPSHCPDSCLHLGRIANDTDAYLDPELRLSSASAVRLVDPNGPVPVPPAGPAGSGILRRPVGGPVTSRFGLRRHPITGKSTLHDGVDFGAACGTPVRAAAAGVVTKRGRTTVYGKRIVVRHSDGLETLYGHLSEFAVGVGDDVTSSTVVGRVGSTGLSTGCHLRFTARRGGRAVDPLTVL